MAITIVANLIAALLDGFAIALLIPFLNILFHQPATTMPKGFVGNLLHTFVGASSRATRCARSGTSSYW